MPACSVSRFRFALPSLLLAVLGGVPRAEAVPDRVAATFPAGTSIDDLSISEDARWVAFVENGSSEVWILDTWMWETTSLAPCSGGTASGVAAQGTGASVTVWTGCSTGEVVSVPITDGIVGTATAICTFTDASVLSVEAQDDTIWALAKGSADTNPKLHSCDPDTGDVDAVVGALTNSTVNDTAITTGCFFVSHGNDDISKVDLATGSAVLPTEMNAALKLADLTAYGSNVFGAAGSGGIVQYNTGSNEFYVLLNETTTDLVDPQALTLLEDGSDITMLTYDAGTSEVVSFNFDTTSLRPDDEELSRFSADNIFEMVAGEGYAYGGGSTGSLQVLTDRPWIHDVSLDAASAVWEQEVRLNFTSDMAGGYRIYLGDSVVDWGSDKVLTEGDASAESPVTAVLTIDDAYEEGINNLWIRLDGDNGLTGHAGIGLTVDNPPGQVSLTQSNVQFGSSQATLSFTGLDAADIATYEVYVTVTSFDPTEWREGGPDFDGADAITTPISIPAPATPGSTVSTTISPLTNGVTYYIAVRAVDEGGQEGEMSDLVSVVPETGVGSAALSGETGGCATVPFRGGIALLLAVGALLGRRRSTTGGLLVVAGLVAAAPAVAHAAKDADKARSASLSVRYGWWSDVADPSLAVIYDQNPQNMVWVEGGPKLSRFLEVEFGAGFYQELSTTVTEDDAHAHSGEHIMMTAWPVTASGTFRLDVVKDQWIVPSVSAGVDWWIWKENWYVNPDVGGDDRMNGGKGGWHYAFRAGLLLDAIDPLRASQLQVNTGIRDTYLTAEWRRQEVGLWDEDGGLTFNGDQVTLGFDFDF